MANEVAGHVSDVDAMDSCVGVEFEADHNWIVAYINEEEISLTYQQAHQLRGQVGQAISDYEWHNATYLYASEGLSASTQHLMKKEGYDRGGKTLCGRMPADLGKIIGGWEVAPILNEPWRSPRTKWHGGTCQRCLAIYDKQTRAPESEVGHA